MAETQVSRDRFVVGYIADARGYDALEFASFMAEGIDAEVRIVMVLPEPNAFGTASVGTPVPSDHIYSQQLRDWADDALRRVPEGIHAQVDFRFNDSAAHGLLDAAAELDAKMIVIGAQAGPLLGKFTLGSVANALLHASPVPVGLAPRRFKNPGGGVQRVTGIYGTRSGSEVVIGRSVVRAVRRDVPLRLVSLVQVDQIAPREVREITDEARRFGGEQLEAVASGLLDSGRATIEIAEGHRLEDALAKIEWLPGDVAYLGSSRLGRGLSVFLGSRARRILDALEAPVVVLPSEFRD
ncbi:universal stress protein [Gulosibacter sp. ACHW.36C]|uniref:Universal stress protein n=1 Tax=Gulosibacter sediminis TaxID=1729695 RepID=A0ABY4MZ49_9MICO|nr:universal stress protein [Gulosibacter sediminis]UQN15289.1 universal stress protein [Gulosibacter sediminis]